MIPSLQHSMLLPMELLSSTSMIHNESSTLLLPMPNMNKIKLPISDKEIIRAEVKQRISLLSEEEKNEAAQSLYKKLLDSEIVQGTQNIIGYHALRDEIALTPFLEAVQKQGKDVFTINTRGDYCSLPFEGIIIVP